MAWVKGAPALNVNVTAYLAYAGLTWDDVDRGASSAASAPAGKAWSTVQVDAAFASTNSGKAYEMAAHRAAWSGRAIHHDNTEGLARMQAIAPFFCARREPRSAPTSTAAIRATKVPAMPTPC